MSADTKHVSARLQSMHPGCMQFTAASVPPPAKAVQQHALQQPHIVEAGPCGQNPSNCFSSSSEKEPGREELNVAPGQLHVPPLHSPGSPLMRAQRPHRRGRPRAARGGPGCGKHLSLGSPGQAVRCAPGAACPAGRGQCNEATVRQSSIWAVACKKRYMPQGGECNTPLHASALEKLQIVPHQALENGCRAVAAQQRRPQPLLI